MSVVGLFYNLENIIFKFGNGVDLYNAGNYNVGYYNSIKGITNNNITGDIFRDMTLNSKIKNIRVATLEDLKGNTSNSSTFSDKEGLFTLDNLSSSTGALEHGISNYIYDAAYYWLASSDNSNTYAMYYVYHNELRSIGKYYFGIRPIVYLSNVMLNNNNNVLEIINE